MLSKLSCRKQNLLENQRMKARTQSNSSQHSDSPNVFTSAPIVLKQSKTKNNNHDYQSQNFIQKDEVESSSQAESISEYTKSGYHPVFLGETFCNQKYEVIQKLGWGTFSTVWLVKNILTNVYFAMKVQKSRKIIQITALDELAILKDIQEQRENKEWLKFKNHHHLQSQSENYCLNLIDKFPHFGMHGTHYCSTFEILGPTLLNIIQYHESRDVCISIKTVKEITKQILLGLVYIHDYCQIIHTDIKPENIMFALNYQQRVQDDLSQKEQLIKNLISSQKVPQSQKFLHSKGLKEKKQKKMNQKIQESIKSQPHNTDKNNSNYQWRGVDFDLNDNIQIKLVDFGNACWVHKHFTQNIQTKEYRSPESIIGAEYDNEKKTKADLWSVGCLVFELLTNNYLFQPESGDGYSENDDHLAMIVETFGSFPVDFLKSGSQSDKYFDSNGKLKNIKDNLGQSPVSTILQEEYQFEENTAVEIENFLKNLLQINPSDRSSARQILQHPWLKN